MLDPLVVDRQTTYFQSSEDMSVLEDGSVQLFITSPPYWNLKDYGSAGEIGASDYDEYLARLNKVWSECYRKAADNAVLIVNVANRRVSKRYVPIAIDIASRMQGWRLWDINHWYIPNALPQPNHYRERLLDNKTEYLLVFTKDGRTDYKFHKPRVPQKYLTADPRSHKKDSRGRCVGNVLRIPAYRPPNVKALNYHVAAFPEELVSFFLECYTDAGDKVCDPFVGSGTTLKVCRVMGRRGYGFELNASFAPLIERRITEAWGVPQWTDVDIIHSTTAEPGMVKPRKVHFAKRAATERTQESLFAGPTQRDKTGAA